MNITNLKALTRKDLCRAEKVLMVIKNADKIKMATNNGIKRNKLKDVLFRLISFFYEHVCGISIHIVAFNLYLFIYNVF